LLKRGRWGGGGRREEEKGGKKRGREDVRPRSLRQCLFIVFRSYGGSYLRKKEEKKKGERKRKKGKKKRGRRKRGVCLIHSGAHIRPKETFFTTS